MSIRINTISAYNTNLKNKDFKNSQKPAFGGGKVPISPDTLFINEFEKYAKRPLSGSRGALADYANRVTNVKDPDAFFEKIVIIVKGARNSNLLANTAKELFPNNEVLSKHLN